MSAGRQAAQLANFTSTQSFLIKKLIKTNTYEYFTLRIAGAMRAFVLSTTLRDAKQIQKREPI
jgi:hypothetical protein